LERVSIFEKRRKKKDAKDGREEMLKRGGLTSYCEGSGKGGERQGRAYMIF